MSYVYYIGRNLEDYNANGTKWSLEGVYSTKANAFEAVDDEEFIVQIEIDKKLPKELHDPGTFWWKINGRILNQDGKIEEA